MEEYPSNSKRPSRKEPAEASKDITPIVSADSVSRRKPGIGRRMSEIFLGGDARTVGGSVLWDFVIPEAKGMLVDAAFRGIEGIVLGETSGRTRRRRGGGGGSFTAYGSHSSSERKMSERDRREIVGRGARRSHSIDDIFLESRHEGDEVLDALYMLLEKYEIVTVADLYRLLNEDATPVDARWGWASLEGSDVRRARGGGYQLVLPSPDHIRD